MMSEGQTLNFEVSASEAPTPVAERERILADPGFGNNFTDHQAIIEWHADNDGEGWDNARIEPYGPISLDPAAAVLHYGQEIFEGLKAYRHADGSIWLFRPEENARRLNHSAQRLALPQLPEADFLEAIKRLVEIDQDWVPSQEGTSLYLRPFSFASEAFLGVRPAREVQFRVIASPAGGYFGPDAKPVVIWVSRDLVRAGHGGTGSAKAGGNYASSLLPQLQAQENGCDQVLYLDATNDDAIEEAGTMNIFFVFADGAVVTPQLTDNVLGGITRDSVLKVAKDAGLNPQERKITLDEVRDGIADGKITEIFASGTAAVITPIGALKDGDTLIALDDPDFAVTNQIRDTLVGIQTGKQPDPYGWVTRVV